MKRLYPRSQDPKSGLYFMTQANCYTLNIIQEGVLSFSSRKLTGVCVCLM